MCILTNLNLFNAYYNWFTVCPWLYPYMWLDIGATSLVENGTLAVVTSIIVQLFDIKL